MTKVLIIDDEIEVGLLLQKFLTRRHFEAQAVQDLASARLAIQSFAPDVLILDNNLPDGSGIETIPEFRTLSPGLQVIAISAMSHLHDRALEQGAFSFLEKPLSLSILQDNILKSVGSK